jgi:hypothetical protein
MQDVNRRNDLVWNDNRYLRRSGTDLYDFISGTANQITVTDDGDGTITLSTPQDIAPASTVTFASVLTGGVTITTNTPILQMTATNASNKCQINFGLVTDTDMGRIVYDNDIDMMSLLTNNTNGITISHGSVINIPNLTASMGIATDGSKNLVSIQKCDSTDDVTFKSIQSVRNINSTTPQVIIENDNASGDAALRFYLSDPTVSMTLGLDNSLAGNPYVMTYGSTLGTTAVCINASNQLGVGIVPSVLLEVGVLAGTATTGDFLVDNVNKQVIVGRLSGTGGDDTIFVVRNRLNVEQIRVEPNYITLGNAVNTIHKNQSVKFTQATTLTDNTYTTVFTITTAAGEKGCYGCFVKTTYSMTDGTDFTTWSELSMFGRSKAAAAGVNSAVKVTDTSAVVNSGTALLLIAYAPTVAETSEDVVVFKCKIRRDVSCTELAVCDITLCWNGFTTTPIIS